jgi:hypothetical protein
MVARQTVGGTERLDARPQRAKLQAYAVRPNGSAAGAAGRGRPNKANR